MKSLVQPAITARRNALAVLREERGAILLLTGVLSMVIVALSVSFFLLSREQRFRSMRERAKIHARYCAEYAVARYGVPAFLEDSDRIDQGDNTDNWITPVSRSGIMTDDFQSDDMGRSYEFGYANLKMDKVFDVTSSQPFYFVSAEGIVTWREGSKVHEVRHTSAVAYTFNDFSRFMYFSNGELSLEGSDVNFRSGDELYGRIHINGAVRISTSCCPIFHGYFTQTEPAPINLGPGLYDQVFQGGYSFPFPAIEWPPDNAIDQIKDQRTTGHTYEGTKYVGDEEYNVTTYIKFHDRQYHVAQYLTDTVTPQVDGSGARTGIYDTTYVQLNGLNWVTKNLPYAEGHQLIYVDGVCRLEGRVMGMITVLSSDTMFIMDDIYTADANVNSNYGSEDLYGMIPSGSNYRIGLASEKDVIIAATPANGAWNGNGVSVNRCTAVMGPAYTGGPASGDITDVTSFSQRNKDVIITAAIFAVQCSFGTEFWHTSATNIPLPNTDGVPGSGTARDPELCAGYAGVNNSHVMEWPCYGNASNTDDRGVIWLCGSLVQTTRGYTIRNPLGPLDPVTIGYHNRYYRYDNNFLNGGPPVWFKVKYTDGTQDVATEMVLPDYKRWLEERSENRVDVAE